MTDLVRWPPLRSGARLLVASALLLPHALACDAAEDAAPAPATVDRPVVEPLPDLPDEIRDARDHFVAAWNGDDPAAVARLYTEDATATAFGTTVRGRAAIEQSWLPNVPIIARLRLTESAVRQIGDDWRTDGEFVLDVVVPDGEPVAQAGVYGITWTRGADGAWRVRSSDVALDVVGSAAPRAP